MPELTDAEIRAMLERAEAATLGPWRTTDGTVLAPDGLSLWGVAGTDMVRYAARNEANKNFVAAARSDVPRLATALLAERQETARLRERLARATALCTVAWPTDLPQWVLDLQAAAATMHAQQHSSSWRNCTIGGCSRAKAALTTAMEVVRVLKGEERDA